MENDVSALFKLLLTNEKFKEVFNKISSGTALLEYIRQALDHLISGSQVLSIGVHVNFVLSYTLQVIVRSMCKSLMQIMTPESVYRFRKCIPYSYLHIYLHHQGHFALKDIIEHEIIPTKRAAMRKNG